MPHKTRTVDPKWVRGKVDELAVAEGCFYDQTKADHVIDFIETFCRKTKGRGDRKVTLIPWQRDLVSRLFGWQRPHSEGPRRRFKTAYVEIPKKNGKSFLCSAIALYMCIADGEGSAEICLAATNGKQARIVWNECAKMCMCHPAIRKRVTVNKGAGRIEHPKSFSKIEVATLDSDALDGIDAHACIVDELHRHKSPKLLDILRYSMVARTEPILIEITTSGQDRNSICWTEHEKAVKVIKGESTDTEHLAIIYGVDPEVDKDLDDPALWHRCNPSIGFTLSEDQFRHDFQEAKESPSGLNNFLRLRLGVWTSPDTSFIRSDHWERGSMTPDDWSRHLEPLKGQPCHCGLDLSSKKDCTAFVMVFGDTETGITVIPRIYIPETQAKERESKEGIPYSQWSKAGLITLTPGPGIDYDLIEAEIKGLAKEYKIKSISTDAWGSAEAVAQRLKASGLKINYMGQGYRTMSEPTKEFERLAIAGKLYHGGHKVLTWMNSNATVKSDPAGNIKIEKPTHASPLKIDAIISAIEGLYGMTLAQKKTNVYSTRGVDFLPRK